MKHGDNEFHRLTGPVIDSISSEGLRIASENKWSGLVIDIIAAGVNPGSESSHLRCTLRNAANDGEVDEPSATMLDSVRYLQELFMNVDTPLLGVTIDWISSGNHDGKFRRRCSFRYD